MGSVTAPENIRWLIPAWAWFALVVWVQSPQVLSVTFSFVFIASTIPFFCRRVGLFRLAFPRDMRGCRHDNLAGAIDSIAYSRFG